MVSSIFGFRMTGTGLTFADHQDNSLSLKREKFMFIRFLAITASVLVVAASAFAGSFECYYVCGTTTGGMSSGYIAFTAASVADANAQMTNWVNNRSACTNGGCMATDPQMQNYLYSFRNGGTHAALKRSCY